MRIAHTATPPKTERITSQQDTAPNTADDSTHQDKAAAAAAAVYK
jgi:hypothetical protein